MLKILNKTPNIVRIKHNTGCIINVPPSLPAINVDTIYQSFETEG